MGADTPDALSAASPWLQEASDIDPRHLALRHIAWEHTEACACDDVRECRLSKIKRAATRGRVNANETPHPATETT